MVLQRELLEQEPQKLKSTSLSGLLHNNPRVRLSPNAIKIHLLMLLFFKQYISELLFLCQKEVLSYTIEKKILM